MNKWKVSLIIVLINQINYCCMKYAKKSLIKYKINQNLNELKIKSFFIVCSDLVQINT